MRLLLSLILFLLAVYGLSNTIAVLKIGRYFLGIGHCTEKECKAPGHPHDKRKFLGRIPYLGDLFYCPPCLAFWLGMACSVWLLSPASQVIETQWKAVLVDGLAASGAIYLFHVIAERLGYGIAEI